MRLRKLFVAVVTAYSGFSRLTISRISIAYRQSYISYRPH